MPAAGFAPFHPHSIALLNMARNHDSSEQTLTALMNDSQDTLTFTYWLGERIDLQRLLDAVIFNFLIGNNDAHGKNFSLLYHGEAIRLAPLYDVLSTTYYPELAKKMAMKIGGEYESAKIFPRHFETLAEDAGLGKALVKSRVPELAELVIASLDKVEIKHPVAEKLAGQINERCRSVLERFGK